MAPPFLANWLAFNESKPQLGMVEHRLYSDAWYTGEVGKLGPYAILNSFGMFGQGRVSAAFYIRSSIHHDFGQASAWPEKSETTHYTGGDLAGDLAALLSLASGGRLRSRGPVREWFDGRDPLGRPSAERQPTPTLSLPPLQFQLLPWTGEQKALPPEDLLNALPRLSPKRAVSLVRAARSYANALWIAETEPELAWLLLVSALETGAAVHFGGETDPKDSLKVAHPELVSALDERFPGAANVVADHLGGRSDLTKKFVRFILEFAPTPPARRPPVACQFGPWTPEGLEELARSVYRLRSKVLHTGLPFPATLCAAPMWLGTSGAPYEKPLPTFIPQMSGGWTEKDAAVHLHIFEYLARNVLLGWWRSLSGPTGSEKPAPRA